MLWSKQKVQYNGWVQKAGGLPCPFFGVYTYKQKEMGLTTSFIDEQSMPMRYWTFVVGSGVIFGLATKRSH